MSALDGVRVLDVGHLTSGPLTSWLLGSLGADVIKVESPNGDGGRTNISASEDAGSEGGYYFHSTNTDKRSVVVDLKSESGRRVLLDLVESADVLVENFRPGTMSDLDVGYETLRRHNPELVYCSITGYGEDNDGGTARAYDSILQAISGMMTVTGYDGDPPTKIGVSLIDNLGSYVASVAVLGALNYRRRTGNGQHIDVSMQDCAAWIVQSLVPFEPGRTAHQPTTAPIGFDGVFEARDGWILVSADDQETKAALVALLSRERDEPTPADEVPPTDRLESWVASWVATEPVDDLLGTCEEYGIPATRVVDIDDVVSLDHLSERDAFADVECHGRTLRIPVSPYCTAMDGLAPPERGGPLLGEHTEEVLTDVLGYSRGEVESLLEEGVGLDE